MNSFVTVEVTTPSDREIRMMRHFQAPRELVFDAWTVPALLKRWLHGPAGWKLAVCQIDLRVGGALRYIWVHDDGRSMGMSGVYREIVRPGRIVATQLFDEDWTGGEAIDTVVLTEQAGRTLLTQTVLCASREARDGALATGMADGVEASFSQLDRLLEEQNKPTAQRIANSE
ncbi:MAG: SRPBCC family protein [Mesorhizobium sp.]